MTASGGTAPTWPAASASRSRLTEWAATAAMLALSEFPWVAMGLALFGVMAYLGLSYAVLGPLLGGLIGGWWRGNLPGRPVHPADEPELHALVQRVASGLAFRDRWLIRVVPVATAELQLVRLRGRRTYVLVLGLPALRRLTASQLSAVIAHEFAHRDHLFRGRLRWLILARARTAAKLGSRVRAPRSVSGRLLKATQRAVWESELEADATAATLVGARPMHRALEAYTALACVSELITGPWMREMADRGCYPQDVYMALDAALEDRHLARRARQLKAEDEALDPFHATDHPPDAARLAALTVEPPQALPDDTEPITIADAEELERWCIEELTGTGGRTKLRAVSLLDETTALFDIPAGEPGRLLVAATGRLSLEQALDHALDAIDDGSWPQLAAAIEPGLSTGPRELRHASARDVIVGCLSRVIAEQLVDAGWTLASRWLTNVVAAPDGETTDLRELILAAVDASDSRPVRAVLPDRRGA